MTDVNLKIRHAKRQNAQNLDLSNLNLESVPQDVYLLKTLLSLNLSNNKIKDIDKMVENLKNLNELNLENNLISNLPIEITNLSNLKKLKLDDNPILENLKDFNFNWKNSIKEFIINGNNLKEEYSSLNSINSLKSLKESNDMNLNLSTNNSNIKKTPFSFNMNNTNNLLLKLQNRPATSNFNFKKKEGIAEIPKCNLFDRDNNLYKSNENNTPNPVRLSSSNLKEKKEALNLILKTKKSQTLNENTNLNNLNNYNNNSLNENDKISQIKNDEISTNNNDNESNLQNLLKIKEKENQIEELKINLNKTENELKNIKLNNNKKDEEYKFTIENLKSEIKILKLKNDSEKKVENVINNKRNWMDSNETNTTKNTTHNLPLVNTRLNLEDNENKIKEIEIQLQKEIQTNKRLKNEIERLTQQLTNNKNGMTSESLMKNVTEINYEEIQLGDKIGQGGFSVIYKGQWNLLEVAVKIIFDPNVTEDLLNEFNNEIKMLSLLRHPNIILLLGISSKKEKLAIITEYLENGSLFDLLHRTKKEITFENKLKIISQLIKTFAFIHQYGIVHRDIKSHNVLIDENLNVKLCDFGLAKYKYELNLGSGQFSGTPAYMAPELFMKKAFDEKIDIFSFGTLMWEILVRKVPYDGYEVGEIKSKVLTDEKLFMPKNIPHELGTIINACRSLETSKRPSFIELGKINFYNIN